MDPITSSIVVALTTGVTASAGKLGQEVILDAYTALKNLLKKKFGDQSDVVKSVESLEAKPESAGRQETLKEEIASAKVDQDPEICKASQTLIDQIRQESYGEQHIQQAIGSYIAQADRSSTSTVNINPSKNA
jgi:hypothetical protein